MKLHRRRRQGISMLETVIYVSLSAVLISVTAQWFHVVFQVASQNKTRQQQHASLKRLSSDFRTDVTSATSVSIISPQQIALVGVTEEETVYRISGGQVDRIVGDVKQPSRQEVYRDLEDLRLEFVKDDSKSVADFVSLNVYRPAKQMKLEKSNQQPSADRSLFEKRLLQVRCGPRLSTREVVQ